MALLRSSERKRWLLLTAAAALISLADIACLALLLALVSYYTTTLQSGHWSWLPGWWTDTGSLLPLLIILLLFLLKNILAYSVNRAQSAQVYQVASRISRDQLSRYFNSDYKEYVARDTAVTGHRISHQPIEFAHYILSGIQILFTELVLSTASLIAILYFNSRLFLLLVLLLGPPLFLATRLAHRKLKTVRAQVQTDAEQSAQYLDEGLEAYIEGNMYQKQSFFTNRYVYRQERLNKHLATLQVTQGMPARLVEVFAVLALVLLIAAGHYYGHYIDFVVIGAFLAAAYKVIPGILRMTNSIAVMHTYAYTISNLSEQLPVTVTAGISTPAPQQISFRDISFSHNGKVLFQQFSCSLQRGDIIHLSGDSGKGKTTLLQLLTGFLAPDSGSIYLDEQAATISSLVANRQHIAYVKQQNFLIHDTISHNITLDAAAPDQQRLENAISRSGLRPFINADPEGIHKIITDSGRNISGGQRQRIAIARALYKQATILVLDEPFNELDEAAERQLLQEWQQLAQSGTMILLVAHSTIVSEYCNKTIIIDG